MTGVQTCALPIFDERAARQLTQAEKAARATYAVRNDGTVEDLRSDLAVILDRLRQ